MNKKNNTYCITEHNRNFDWGIYKGKSSDFCHSSIYDNKIILHLSNGKSSDFCHSSIYDNKIILHLSNKYNIYKTNYARMCPFLLSQARYIHRWL